MEKINCGGFYVGDGLELDGKVLKGSGITDAPADGKQYARQDHHWTEVQSSGGGAMVVNFTTTDEISFTADKTFEEVRNAFPNVIGVLNNVIIFNCVSNYDGNDIVFINTTYNWNSTHQSIDHMNIGELHYPDSGDIVSYFDSISF